jgi:hypothetical protein
MFSVARAASAAALAGHPRGLGDASSLRFRRGSARSARVAHVTRAAKGRNARLAGRDKKAQSREDDKMLDNAETAAAKRAAKRKQKRDPNVKYSKRGVVSSQPGQVSKAALKRVREATRAKQTEAVVDEEKLSKKRDQYQQAQGRAIPQQVTDRMLKRITIFSGVPLLFGFSTGPIFYGLKVFAHADVAPWQFFVASTATFGAALVGITYGVLSASWEPGREGTFWGLEEFKTNIPILLSTVAAKATGRDPSDWDDEWDDGQD